MSALTAPKLAKWPFLVGDALLLVTAWFVYGHGEQAHTIGQLALTAACVGLGAALAILPFVLEYLAVTRLAEAETVGSVVAQIKNLDAVAAQISSATGHWQTAQDAADKTSTAATAIAERMTSEAKNFMEFIEKANSSEKAALRLEVDKMKRAEADWMQVLVRILDHIYAVVHGARKSAQPGVVEQLGRFQHACYDAARRIGLAPFTAAPAEVFNPEKHQLPDPNGKAPSGAIVDETLATGFTYQGRVVRPALVRLRVASAGETQQELPGQPGATTQA